MSGIAIRTGSKWQVGPNVYTVESFDGKDVNIVSDRDTHKSLPVEVFLVLFAPAVCDGRRVSGAGQVCPDCGHSGHTGGAL